MSRSGRASLDSKVYVGDLPRDVTEKDLERHFNYYGRLRSVWVARNPPGFAFIEYEDNRDASDAVRSLDGSSINGCRIRVEHSSGKVRQKPWQRGGGGGGGSSSSRSSDRGPPRNSRRAFNPDDKCYECGERGHYAYDCSRQSKGHKRSRSRSRSDSRSRSRSPRRRTRSRSPSKSVSRSPVRSRSRSGSREKRNGFKD